MSSAKSKSLVGKVLQFTLLMCMGVVPCLAQKDPGARKAAARAGNPLPGLTPIELSMFNEGLQRAIQLEAVCDDCADLVLGAFVVRPRRIS